MSSSRLSSHDVADGWSQGILYVMSKLTGRASLDSCTHRKQAFCWGFRDPSSMSTMHVPTSHSWGWWLHPCNPYGFLDFSNETIGFPPKLAHDPPSKLGFMFTFKTFWNNHFSISALVTPLPINWIFIPLGPLLNSSFNTCTLQGFNSCMLNAFPLDGMKGLTYGNKTFNLVFKYHCCNMIQAPFSFVAMKDLQNALPQTHCCGDPTSRAAPHSVGVPWHLPPWDPCWAWTSARPQGHGLWGPHPSSWSTRLATHSSLDFDCSSVASTQGVLSARQWQYYVPITWAPRWPCLGLSTTSLPRFSFAGIDLSDDSSSHCRCSSSCLDSTITCHPAWVGLLSLSWAHSLHLWGWWSLDFALGFCAWCDHSLDFFRWTSCCQHCGDHWLGLSFSSRLLCLSSTWSIYLWYCRPCPSLLVVTPWIYGVNSWHPTTSCLDSASNSSQGQHLSFGHHHIVHGSGSTSSLEFLNPKHQSELSWSSKSLGHQPLWRLSWQRTAGLIWSPKPTNQERICDLSIQMNLLDMLNKLLSRSMALASPTIRRRRSKTSNQSQHLLSIHLHSFSNLDTSKIKMGMKYLKSTLMTFKLKHMGSSSRHLLKSNIRCNNPPQSAQVHWLYSSLKNCQRMPWKSMRSARWNLLPPSCHLQRHLRTCSGFRQHDELGRPKDQPAYGQWHLTGWHHGQYCHPLSCLPWWNPNPMARLCSISGQSTLSASSCSSTLLWQRLWDELPQITPCHWWISWFHHHGPWKCGQDPLAKCLADVFLPQKLATSLSSCGSPRVSCTPCCSTMFQVSMLTPERTKAQMNDFAAFGSQRTAFLKLSMQDMCQGTWIVVRLHQKYGPRVAANDEKAAFKQVPSSTPRFNAPSRCSPCPMDFKGPGSSKHLGTWNGLPP